ncbi:MAG: dTDP-4-dehydrorhamnose reductase family protein [Gemmobacter sp.]
MRVLVLGATGMLGHALVGALLAGGHAVAGTIRPAAAAGAHAQALAGAEVIGGIDLAEPGALARAFDASRPDAVVNCAGMIKQKAGDEDRAALVRLNALLPHAVAAEASGRGVRFIHISTDCVFSGRRGLYAETDPTDPTDAYGMSKLLGEVGAPHLTLRTSLVGWQIGGAESLLEWFWAQRGGTARGFTRAFFSGFSTPAFARILAEVLTDHPALSGLWHVAAPRISKFDLLSGLNDRLGRPVALVPDAELAIDRSLDGRRFATETAISLPDWPAMLDELAMQRARSHAD